MADFNEFELSIDWSAKKDLVFAQYFGFEKIADATDPTKAKFKPQIVGTPGKPRLRAGDKPVKHAPGVANQIIRAVVVRLQVDGGQPFDMGPLKEMGPGGGAGQIGDVSLGYYGIDVSGKPMFLLNHIG